MKTNLYFSLTLSDVYSGIQSWARLDGFGGPDSVHGPLVGNHCNIQCNGGCSEMIGLNNVRLLFYV